MLRHSAPWATAIVAALVVSSTPSAQPPEPPQPAEMLTAKLGTPENKAVAAIFEAWNSTHTRARAAIKTATDRYRAKKEQVPPVVYYAGALVMMQIGAYAAPDVESSLLPKAGDHPLVSMAIARVAVREGDFERATKSADQAVDDKRCGELGAAMKEAVVAMSKAGAGGSKVDSSSSKTR